MTPSTHRRLAAAALLAVALLAAAPLAAAEGRGSFFPRASIPLLQRAQLWLGALLGWGSGREGGGLGNVAEADGPMIDPNGGHGAGTSGLAIDPAYTGAARADDGVTIDPNG